MKQKQYLRTQQLRIFKTDKRLKSKIKKKKTNYDHKQIKLKRKKHPSAHQQHSKMAKRQKGKCSKHLKENRHISLKGAIPVLRADSPQKLSEREENGVTTSICWKKITADPEHFISKNNPLEIKTFRHTEAVRNYQQQTYNERNNQGVLQAIEK